MARRRTITGTKPPGLTLAKSFNVSVFLHVLPLFLLLFALPTGCISCGQGGGGSGDQEKKQEEKKSGNIGDPDDREIKDKDKPVEVEITNVPVQKGEEQLAYEAALDRHEKCEPFFGGIGVSFDPWNGTVIKVYKYYPAWSAGLQNGDKIFNFGEIKGEVGTEFVLKYARDGVKMELKMKRGRICLDDAVKERKVLQEPAP